MKKMIKVTMLILAVVLMAGMLTACSDNGIEGYYKLVGGQEHNALASEYIQKNGNIYLVIKGDGTCTEIKENGEMWDFPWDDRYFYEYGNSEYNSYELKDGKIYFRQIKDPRHQPVYEKITSKSEKEEVDQLIEKISKR